MHAQAMNARNWRNAPRHPETADRDTYEGRLESSESTDAVATVLHDLRASVGSITLGFEVLLENFDSVGRDEAVTMLRRMQRSTSWVQSLIENLTVAAQVQTKQLYLRWESVKLADVVETALAVVLPLTESRQQRIVCDLVGEDDVWGDARRIEQVVINLLMNASKYSPEGGTLTLDVKRDGTFARISVMDEGPGVSAGDMERIFDRYVRGQTAGPLRVDGLGLGLFIVKSIVERHGGSVGLETTAGLGSSFWFTLPLAQCPGTRDQLSSARSTAGVTAPGRELVTNVKGAM